MITYALFYLCQHILELGIVDLNTVVQVDLDHLIGQVMQLFLVGNGLGQLVLELFDALSQRATFSPRSAVASASSASAICER